MFAHIPIHAHACIYVWINYFSQNTIIFTDPMYLNDKPSVRCIAACPEMLSHTVSAKCLFLKFFKFLIYESVFMNMPANSLDNRLVVESKQLLKDLGLFNNI